MKNLLSSIAIAVIATAAQAQSTIVYELWPDGAPTSNELEGPEIDIDGTHVTNVTKPTLTVHIPQKCNGKAIIACPGGAYVDVWINTEGNNLADWYNEQGIVYAVLKYRLPNAHREVPLDDVHKAMEIMKSHSEEWGFSKLGIQGCSAGGHLAATAATHFKNEDERPDFQILFYPVISCEASFTHMQSRENLIGKNAPQDMVDLYSNEKQVTTNTPQAFIMASSDDGLVPVRNSIEYYNSLVKNNVPTSLHIYPTGGHGWCGHESFSYRQLWMSELKYWLSNIE